jgi:hypothetical protein
MVTQVLPSSVIDVREYIDARGRSPYAKWFNRLPAQAAAKMAVAVTRMHQGNLSNVKGIGEGVLEYRIDWSGLSHLLRPRRRDHDHLARRRHQATAGPGYRPRQEVLERLPPAKNTGVAPWL